MPFFFERFLPFFWRFLFLPFSQTDASLFCSEGSCLFSSEGSYLFCSEGSCLFSSNGSCLFSSEGSCLLSSQGSCLFSEGSCHFLHKVSAFFSSKGAAFFLCLEPLYWGPFPQYFFLHCSCCIYSLWSSVRLFFFYMAVPTCFIRKAICVQLPELLIYSPPVRPLRDLPD